MTSPAHSAGASSRTVSSGFPCTASASCGSMMPTNTLSASPGTSTP
eukprot:CAMPEP_0119122840 /NCGR_PEP_ID=MMETSP1310-20130426/2982_1 /TAXON_ID=464262 /ORGANISM="Genus nov. species nov., Strain RCC2339" /LENGTH=45 /DNA_ID= /DNA_START= /DNA_END= /DNA_ORIENTATION=